MVEALLNYGAAQIAKSGSSPQLWRRRGSAEREEEQNGNEEKSEEV